MARRVSSRTLTQETLLGLLERWSRHEHAALGYRARAHDLAHAARGLETHARQSLLACASVEALTRALAEERAARRLLRALRRHGCTAYGVCS